MNVTTLFSHIRKETVTFMDECEFIEFYEQVYHHEVFENLKNNQLVYSDIPVEKE